MKDHLRPFIAKTSTFHETFPSVESATMIYDEKDSGWPLREKDGWSFAKGPVIPCRNPKCHRGGYDFDWRLRNMIDKGIQSEHIDYMRCPGDEGTPAGRKQGDLCGYAITGTITIRYKENNP